MKFANNVDLSKHELQNAVFQNLSGFPANPKNGQVFYHTGDNTVYFYDGSGWEDTKGQLTPAQIKTLYESNADTNAFTDALVSKLAGIENGATADLTGPEIAALYEALSNTNKFTDAEKTKLAGLESSKFLGTYTTLSALQSTHPSPVAGSYGDVDAGISSDVQRYIWDSDDNQYVQQSSGGGETAASVKTKYESNPDTNALTDALLSKLNALLEPYTATINGDDSATTFNLTHNLGTRFISVTVRDDTTNEEVLVDNVANGDNTCQIIFGTAPASGTNYKVIVRK